MICNHISEQNYTSSVQGIKIYKDQCVKCFYEVEDENGIFVCLKCFQGQCNQHLNDHSSQFNHNLYLQIKKIQIIEPQVEQPSDKLQILDNGPKYETFHQLFCNQCKQFQQIPQNLDGVIQSILKSDSAFQQSNLDTWELEINPCEHSLCIQQLSSQKIDNNKMAHCGNCELSSNLWLCLTCGYLGCGRKYFDGTGGNNHAIDHSKSMNHPCVVKLGTISAEGNASVHCYACDDEVKDIELIKHLENFGIKVSNLVKTEKTIMEMTIDLNLNLQLSKTMEDGKVLKNIYGPGLTGLRNLGNSCYINSVIQVLFSIPEIQMKYQNSNHLKTCILNPEECTLCQIQKLAQGLLSGEYSIPIDQDDSQKGIKIQSFKQLIGKGHQEFQSNRQQDASEYLQHLLNKLQQEILKKKMEKQNQIQETEKIFQFQQVHKMVCQGCNGYKLNENQTSQFEIKIPYIESEGDYPVQFDYQIQNQDQQIQYFCSNCQKQQTFIQKSYFKSLPQYLIVQIQRFSLENWVPTKIQAYLQQIQDLNLNPLMFKEPSQNEVQLKDSKPEDNVDQDALMNLMSMGFSKDQCTKALKVCKNNIEQAAEWLFSDNNESEPMEQENDQQDENVGIIVSMGFNQNQASFALKQCDNNVERAIDYLFSHPDCGEDNIKADNTNNNQNYELIGSIVHLGKSVHCGHYVCYCKINDQWVYFNDNKVAKAEDPLVGKGYILVYKQKL